jgi:hypothetical protein
MKSYHIHPIFLFSILILFSLALTNRTTAEKDRPAGNADEQSGDQVINELLSRPVYNPLPGQIPRGVEDISHVSAAFATIVNTLQPGSQGQASPWFAKLQSLETKLTQLGASRLQTDVFALVSEIGEFFAADGNAPEFVNQAAASLHALDVVMIDAVKQHIIEQNAAISASNMQIFIKIFSNNGFVNEPDWEEQPIPVDSAGIMILDAAAVVTQLKTRPWQEAGQFLGNNTATEAFGRYAVSGNGIAILKTKYAADQATITAKWNELAAWVVTQRPPN